MAYALGGWSRMFAGVQLRKAGLVVGWLAALGAGTAHAQDLYVNATVGGAFAPGVYGQISFGTQPPPPVLYAQPVWIQRAPVQPPPLYLYVPPGHSKNWGKFCGRYNACGRPVYFVRVNDSNRWWEHGRGGPEGQGRPEHRQGHRQEDRREDRRDDRRQDFRQDFRANDQGDRGGPDRGREHGHGRGHGNHRMDD
jgi:hypothetical protein